MTEPPPEGWEAAGSITIDRDGKIDIRRIGSSAASYYRWWWLPSGRLILDPVIPNPLEESTDDG